MGAKKREADVIEMATTNVTTVSQRTLQGTGGLLDLIVDPRDPKLDNDNKQIRFTISHAQLLPIIHSLLGFVWSHRIHGDLEGRDKSRFCESQGRRASDKLLFSALAPTELPSE